MGATMVGGGARFQPEADSESPPPDRCWKFVASERFDADHVRVGGNLKLRLVIVFVTCAEPTLYVSVPLLSSVNERRIVPTTLRMTAFGFQGEALNAGPVLRTRSPAYEPSACFAPFDIDTQGALPLASSGSS